MQKWVLGLEYDGSSYHGWQRQKNGIATVQEALDQSLSKVANAPIQTICAGRTDTGVHALGQVIHFESTVEREPRAWHLGGNLFLPEDVSIQWVKPTSDDFHARFSATARRYVYLISNKSSRSGLFSKQVTWFLKPLDIDLMQQAAKLLEGEHNFNAYRGQGCQAHSPVRTIHWLKVRRYGDYVLLDIKANAFLLHMVRNIAGVLMKIGAKERPVYWAQEVLEGQDRTKGGVTARPNGLFFYSVDYPEDFSIPKQMTDPLQLLLVQNSE